MFEKLETIILSSIQAIYDALGWFGVAMLLVFENATGITPSEVILGLAGWMLISEHQLPPSMILLGGLYAAFGSVMGASIAYWAARLGGRPLVDKIAHWVRIRPAHISRAELLFQRFGAGLVLVGRIIPGIRTLISIPAGLARMNFMKFVVATFTGAYFWCTLLIGCGYMFGHEWPLISSYMKLWFPYLALGGSFSLAVYFIVTWKMRNPAGKIIRS